MHPRTSCDIPEAFSTSKPKGHAAALRGCGCTVDHLGVVLYVTGRWPRSCTFCHATDHQACFRLRFTKAAYLQFGLFVIQALLIPRTGTVVFCPLFHHVFETRWCFTRIRSRLRSLDGLMNGMSWNKGTQACTSAFWMAPISPDEGSTDVSQSPSCGNSFFLVVENLRNRPQALLPCKADR